MLKKQRLSFFISLKHWDTRTIFMIFCLFYFSSAIFFSEQRIIFLDNALHIFNSIATGEPGVMAGRWPVSIVRIPLAIAIYLKMDLSLLLLIYSLSHCLLIIGIGLLIKKYASQDNLKLFLITYLIVLGHTFFWCVSEIIPALLLASIYYKSESTNIFLKFLCIVLIVFSHPQAIIALVFVFTYQFIKNKSKEAMRLLLFAVLIYSTKAFYFPNWYDTMKMGVLMDGLKSDPFQFLHYKSLTTFFKQNLIWLPVVLFVVFISIQLAVKRQWFIITFYLSFVVGILYLFIMSNPNHISNFYTESNLYLISIISGIVFLDNCTNDKIVHRVIIICFGLAILKVGFASIEYTHRLNYVKDLTKQLPFQKNLIDKAEIDLDLLQLEWGLPFETLILSTLENGSASKTLVAFENKELEKQKNQNQLLNGMGGSFDIPPDKSYFNLDTGLYHIIRLKGGPERK